MKIDATFQNRVKQLADRSSIERELGRLEQRYLATGSISPTAARAVLRLSGSLDDGLFRDFNQLLQDDDGLRIALYDLFAAWKPQANESVTDGEWSGDWLRFLMAGYAHQADYPLPNLAALSAAPQAFSPAGMILQQTVGFMRQQLQRSATERGRLANRLQYDQLLAPTLETLPGALGDEAASAAPPHYRTPVPVNYPEYNQPVQISVDDLAQPSTPAPLPVTSPSPVIRITAEEIPPARRTPAAPTRRPARPPAPPDPLGQSIRKLFRGKDLRTTKLRIVVKDYPDGSGIEGLQVTVRNKRVRSYVAGTTNRNGVFLCELPVLVQSGLTYEVEVTWSRDFGGEIEHKSVTLNNGRAEFTLPFYHRSLP